MAWVLVIGAGLMEIAFAVSLKQAHGFSRLWPTLATFATGGASFFTLALALRSLPVGTAYAVWTGIGAAGTVAVGIVLLDESASFGRLLAITLIVTGIVGLKLYEH
jgi:quaternary ammonium compound-resistance protein SugE